MKESVLALEAAVEIAVKWKKQCGEQELQVVWKYIYHIPLPYMDSTELSGYSCCR